MAHGNRLVYLPNYLNGDFTYSKLLGYQMVFCHSSLGAPCSLLPPLPALPLPQAQVRLLVQGVPALPPRQGPEAETTEMYREHLRNITHTYIICT